MPPADREPRQHARASCPRRQDPHLRTATPRITESVTEPARWHLFATLFGTTAACQRPASATDSAKQCGQKLPNNSAIHRPGRRAGRRQRGRRAGCRRVRRAAAGSVYRCSARAVRASGLVRHCRVASSVASGQYTGLGHPQRRFRGSLVGEQIRAGRELEGRPGSRCASTGAKYRAQIEHAGRGLVVVTGRPPVSGSDGDPPSGLVTLLFTNIEGSTRLLRRVGDHYNDLLERHRQIIRDASVAEGGFEIGHEGDSVRIVFQTASDGITAALAAQRALHDESWPTGCAVRVRMGLHTGPVAYASGQYAGITVHDAARVANAARGGQIVCSETTADCTTLPAGTSLRSLGLHRLTDPAVEMTLFQICHGDLPLSFPTLRSMAPTSGIVVGRGRELGRLDGLLGAAHAGSGTLLVIAGEPGIGKSTLLVELARRSAGMGMPC